MRENKDSLQVKGAKKWGGNSPRLKFKFQNDVDST